ncbi:ADP-ribosyl cyclase/cyclic ADP-ribose hydrolase 1 [Dissostichus eleginoides]|uniref:ADP-ribosyl cyclase/cyclic ADP-ribose hydrolase n=1 Tax=Dissostichus eleginoides TaxID=100907 RepID=A0AAD9F4L8_DISEL|nr:ADP-ribosyl cyclase/cyclic ADP-ribose hydrolase 1 [Dissostichus eleginoides]
MGKRKDTIFWSKTKNLVRDLTKNRDDVVALEDTLLGSVLDGLTWCGEKGNSDFACDDVTAILDGSIDTPFDPERADCNNPSLKDLQRALDQGITYNCKEVTDIFASIEVKRFDYPRVQSLNVVLNPDPGLQLPSRETLWSLYNCTEIWHEFEKAYVNRDPCKIPMNAYDSLVAAAPFEHACNKTLFWSKTKNLVRDLTKNRDDVVALEDTLLGSVLDGLTWCGKMGSSESSVALPLNTPRRARESRHVIGQCRLPYVIQDPDYKMCGINRYDVCVAVRSTGEKPHSAAVHLPESLLRDNQSKTSAASSDVRMKAQICILEEQRQELLCINEKWAKEYRTMVRYYKERVQDLKTLLQHDPLAVEICEGGKNVTSNKKAEDKENTWTGEEVLKAEKEAEELRAQNNTLTRRGQHQHEEILRLNKALEEALQNTNPLDASSETLQDIWKHQAQVYKEDFLTERRDREKLKEKNLEQESKYRKVHSELRVLKSQVARTPQPVLECTCTNRATTPNWEVREINQKHIQLQRRIHLTTNSEIQDPPQIRVHH